MVCGHVFIGADSSWLGLAALLAPAVLFAGFVRGLTGFGGPLLLVPVFVTVFPPAAGAFIVALVDLLSNVGLLPDATKRMSRRAVVISAAGAAVTVPFGIVVMTTADPAVVRDIIYVVVGLAALILLTGFRFPRPLRMIELLAGGALAGVVMGATSLGIVIVPFLFSMPEPAATTRANVIVWAFLLGIFLVVALAFKGVVGGRELMFVAVFSPIYLAGVILGKKLFNRLNELAFRRGVLIFLFGIAAVGLMFN